MIGRAPMMRESKYIMAILELLIRGYAELIIDGQVKMLTSTLAADERLSMGLQQSPVWTSLEEPFCWRPLSNRLGLHAFALDLFLWRTKMTAIGDNPSKKGRLRPAKRGFSERGSGYENSAANLEGFSTEDASLHCGFVEFVVAEFEKICGSGSDFISPRVLLPSNLLVPFQGYLEAKDAGLAWDVVEYEGDCPRSELLVTVQHSVVIIVREAAWSSPERAWQLHSDTLGDQDVAGPAAAPVVVLTVMQHGVEVGPNVVKKVMQLWMRVMEEDVIRAEDAAPWSFFAPVTDALQFRAANVSAAKKLSTDIAPLLRECFTLSWAKIRERRLGELRRARSQLSRLEKQRAALEVAKGKLEEAVNLLDRVAFERQAAEAVAEKLVPQAQVDQLAKRLASRLEKAEAPFRQLVASRCRQQQARGGAAAPDETASVDSDAEVLAVLEAELERTVLAPDSPWVNAAKSLQSALGAAERLRVAVGAASADPGSGGGVAELAQAVTGCESAVSLLEASARTASGASSTRASGLRQAIAEAREAMGRARADEALREVLSSAPWAGGPLELSDMTKGALQALERVAAAATEAGRSCVAPKLDSALAAGRSAVALREAQASSDAELLRGRLRAARDLGLTGLEGAEERLRRLEEAVESLRAELAAAVASLDVAGFEGAAERARDRGIVLPGTETTRLKAELAAATVEAEGRLRELLTGGEELSQGPVREASARLPDTSALRVLADAVCEAIDARAVVAASVEEAAAGAEVAGDPRLQAALAQASGASARLDEALRDAGARGGAAENVANSLREVRKEGESTLSDVMADRALAEALEGPPWGQGPGGLLEATEGDLQELQDVAGFATNEGRARMASALDAALKAGNCVVGLRQAMDSDEASLEDRCRALEHRVAEADELGLLVDDSQREIVQERLSELRELAAAAADSATGSTFHGRSTDQLAENKWGQSLGQNRCSNLIFMDLELTAGFYEFHRKPKILECAVLITDKDLNELGRGCWVVGGFSKEELMDLGEFHQNHFRDKLPGGPFPGRPGNLAGGNGLFADVLNSSTTMEEVEEAALSLIRRHCPDPGACPLVGYSVQCDREVLKVEMPQVYRHLSHRIIDVSSFFQMARLWVPERLQLWEGRDSQYNHRALNDVEDSVEALRFARQHLFQKRTEAAGAGRAQPGGTAVWSPERSRARGFGHARAEPAQGAPAPGAAVR